MARLGYFMIASLDGYVADPSGAFDWGVPDEEVLSFINERERRVGTYLLGRRMYEIMSVWETDPTLAAEPAEKEFAAIWTGAEKVVYSTSLASVPTARTRLERRFDAAAVERLKRESATDLSVAGPELAGHALRAGLVDELHLIVAPVVLGGGTSLLPAEVGLRLDLADSARFGNGMVSLRYDVRRG